MIQKNKETHCLRLKRFDRISLDTTKKGRVHLQRQVKSLEYLTRWKGKVRQEKNHFVGNTKFRKKIGQENQILSIKQEKRLVLGGASDRKGLRRSRQFQFVHDHGQSDWVRLQVVRTIAGVALSVF